MSNSPDVLGFYFDSLSVHALQAEMISAVAKHGWAQTPLNPEMSDERKLVILVEEIGEVARAMTYDNGSKDKLIHELLQTCAMALSWVQSIDGG